MVKTRIREWLMDHPEALTFFFLLLLKWKENVPDDATVLGGSSGFQGP